MKKLLATILAFSFILSACDGKKESAKSEKPTVKIGASLPLTGNMAVAGKNMQFSMNMALQDLQEQNDLSFNYLFVVEDDQYAPRKAVLNFNKLKSIDKIDALISFWGNIGTLASSFAEQNKLVHMSCAFSNVVGKGLYNFNHATKPITHVNNIINFYKQHNVKNLGVIRYNSLEVDELMKVFKKELKKNNINLIHEIAVNSGEKDFRIALINMKKLNPDMLFVSMLSPSAEILSKQIKEIGLDNIQITNLNDLSFVSEHYENAVIFTEETGGDAFRKHFQDFAGMNVMPCTANIYDGTKMLITAFETLYKQNNKKPTEEELAHFILKNKSFKSVMSQIDIDSDGNINSPSIIKQIRNAKLTDYIEK